MGAVKLARAVDINGKPSDEIFRLAYLNASLQSGMANSLDEAIHSAGNIEYDRSNKVDDIPYDFIRKRLSIVVSENQSNLIITKGALQKILEICTYFEVDNQVESLNDSQINQILKNHANGENRVFAFLASQREPLNINSNSPASMKPK